ncbi:type VII secretion-associated serine protease mycosin [Streptomyces sp. URMC 123]|uniref:type VII secretion-associated serine protease mycosin n=1 Tax=Streptomyces sp. URMC 123 TaxID=3423403 RepID=UPI003F1E30B7
MRGTAGARAMTVTLAAVLLTGASAASGTGAMAADRTGGPRAANSTGMWTLDGSGECTYPMKEQIKAVPWALQRVVFDELWQDTKGKGVRVAVIDTGVDETNPQLTEAVDTGSGADLIEKGKDGTDDAVGHGTKVAGIIAARPRAGTGFVGLAPESTIIPIRQNDEKGTGTAATLAQAIRHAIDKKARVINISQDTAKPLRPDSDLALAVRQAQAADIVVVASAGNDGLDGNIKETYPAAYAGVLAVAASDRNNERAPFSQSGDFVGIAAPGVDMVSTVPKGGQCVDNGTSFSAPYVAGVAALIRAKHPDWKQHQVIAQIQQTAERSVKGHDRFVGWGVVDPVRALTEDEKPLERPTADTAVSDGPADPEPAALTLGETPAERRERLATYVLGGAAVLITVIAGTAVVLRDWRRRRARAAAAREVRI